ncbi:MAG: hypothetical protein ACE5IL_00130 [Myxococcota bacterium]
MRERRAHLRFCAPIRLRVRQVGEASREEALQRVRGRRVPLAPALAGPDDGSSGTDARLVLGLLQQIAATLERIETRLSHDGERGEPLTCEREIRLSASGLAIPRDRFEADLGDLVEVELELPEDGIPRIRALARGVRSFHRGGRPWTALSFEELGAEDRERLVQVALRRDLAELRERRAVGRA